MLAVVKDILRHRELLVILVGRNLKIRYKSSALGFCWSLLVPLFLIVIYSTFLRLLKIPIDLPSLVTGILVWQFLALCLGDSLHAVVGNANLVTKAAFPRIMLPLAMVLANLVNFALSFAVLSVYLLFAGAGLPGIGWVPVIAAVQLLLCLGVALVFAAANVFFRDAEHLLSMVMLAWFFLSPVIYDAGLVTGSGKFPAWVSAAFFGNPMTGILCAYRAALLGAPWPAARLLGLSAGVAAAVAVAGVWLFQRLQPLFGDEL